MIPTPQKPKPVSPIVTRPMPQPKPQEPAAPTVVRIAECSDRYLIINVETGEDMEPDQVGFSYESSARDYAIRKGWEIQP